MKAIAVHDKFINCPPDVAKIGSSATENYITVGKEYEIFAVAKFNIIKLQFVNDADIIDWLPAWFFNITDPAIPDDWICNIFSEDKLLIGPEFVAKSHEAYSEMVQFYPEKVKAFKERLLKRKSG